MPPYASVANVRAVDPLAGVPDATITAAVVVAESIVDQVTGERFTPTTLTVRANMANGVAFLPLRARSVTAVWVARPDPDGTLLAASSYYVTTSETRGESDALRLTGSGFGGVSLASYLDVTIEPVRHPYGEDVPVYVTGSFGWDDVPVSVRDATVLLALDILARAGEETTGTGSVNVEGDADLGTPPMVPTLEEEATEGRTTGNATADALLAPYVRRNRLRIT